MKPHLREIFIQVGNHPTIRIVKRAYEVPGPNVYLSGVTTPANFSIKGLASHAKPSFPYLTLVKEFPSANSRWCATNCTADTTPSRSRPRRVKFWSNSCKGWSQRIPWRHHYHRGGTTVKSMTSLRPSYVFASTSKGFGDPRNPAAANVPLGVAIGGTGIFATERPTCCAPVH